MYNSNRQVAYRQNLEETKMNVEQDKTRKVIRIRTRLVKDTIVEEGDYSYVERVTGSVVITAAGEDLVRLHDKIAICLSK